MKLSLSLKVQGREYKSPTRGIAAFRAIVDQGFDDGVKSIKPQLQAFLDEVINKLIEKHSGKWPGGTSATSLSKRTGQGVKSLRDGIKLTGNRLDTLRARLQIPTPMAYHESGYTKQAGGKFLTIPLPAALDANGVPLKRDPRAWKNTFTAYSKAGNLIIFQRIAGRRIVPLYVLRSSVTAPPRLGASAAFQSAIPYFQSRMADAFVAALK